MALVLACSVPTGLPEVVQLRIALGNFVSLRVKPPCSSDRTTCVHVNDFVGARDASTVYIGGGVTDCQLRPAVFLQPFRLASRRCLASGFTIGPICLNFFPISEADNYVVIV